MAGHQKDPLRPLTPDERLHLEQVSRSRTDLAAQVARAREVLAVTDGASFEAAARLGARFNRDGIDTLVERLIRPGGDVALVLARVVPCV